MFIFFITGSEKANHRYLQGVGIVLIGFFIRTFFFFIADFISADQIYWDLGVLIGVINLTFFVFVIEKFVYKGSKYLFTGFGCFASAWNIVFFILQNRYYINIGQICFLPFLVVIIPVVYFYIAIKSSGKARIKSSIITIGILIFLFGALFHFEVFKTSFVFGYYILAPLFLIGGLSLYIYGLS